MAAQKFFFLSCGFLAGVIITAFLGSFYNLFYWLALLVFFGCAVFFRQYLLLLSIFFIGSFFAVFYFGFRSDLVERGYPKIYVGSFEIVSTSETLTTDKSRRFFGNLDGEYRGEVLVFYSTEDDFNYGERFVVSGEFELSEKPGSVPVIFAKEIKRIDGGSKTIGWYLLNFKNKLVGVINEELSPRAAALASGILLGDKTNFDADFKEAMKRSGTTHIVALSGFNISILVGALALVVVGFKRRTRIFLYFFVITTFTLMVGAEPSIVRAAIMGGIFLLGKELGRDITPAYALSFAGLVMLVWNPLIIYSVGFQLSFLSFMGIVYIAPAIAGTLGFGGGVVSRLAVETVSAQLAVLPLIINYFGTFSVMSFFANILILGTVPISMFFVFVLLVLNFSLPIFLFLINWICEIILGYQIAIINLFSKIYIPTGDYFKNGLFTAIYVFFLLGLIIIGRNKVVNERK